VRATFSPAEESFRSEVRAFLAGWRDLDGYLRMGTRWGRVTALWRALGERGWLSLSWPESAGGRALPPTFEYLLWDEAAYARAARAPLDAGIVAKSLLRYGSDAQKERWLPGIRRGDTWFSLGYSEPEAGSDLASVRTRAERRGDAYVVTGEKCWTSYAEHTHWLWTLVRTGAPESRGDGLSLLIVDLHAPGVAVEPLPTLDGEQLNAIRLDGVEVPLDQRVGPENGAWKIMAEALADERHVQFPPGRLCRDLDDLVADVRARGLASDPLARRALADLSVRVLECEAHALRVLDAMLHGRPAAVEAAANKVSHTEVAQEIAQTALELGGPEALIAGSGPDVLWRQSLWETIGGGTSEIMRSVVARQGLGLR
jgi:alkylation response protein AidB-like acyl-CoA dehydrogenase